MAACGPSCGIYCIIDYVYRVLCIINYFGDRNRCYAIYNCFLLKFCIQWLHSWYCSLFAVVIIRHWLMNELCWDVIHMNTVRTWCSGVILCVKLSNDESYVSACERFDNVLKLQLCFVATAVSFLKYLPRSWYGCQVLWLVILRTLRKITVNVGSHLGPLVFVTGLPNRPVCFARWHLSSSVVVCNTAGGPGAGGPAAWHAGGRVADTPRRVSIVTTR